MWNARIPKTNVTGYRGVYKRVRGHTYQSSIKINGKDVYLGNFKTQIEAARAYDQAALKRSPDFARLNFPSLPAAGHDEGGEG